MSVSVFSDISAKSSANFSNAVPTASQKNAVTKDVNKNKEADEKASKKEKIIKGIKTAVPIALPLIAIPVTALITYKISNKNFIKNNNILKEEIQKLSKELDVVKEQSAAQIKQAAENIAVETQAIKSDNSKIWKLLIALGGVGGAYTTGQLTADDKDEITDKVKQRFDNIDARSNDAYNAAQSASDLSNSGLNHKYTKSVNGVNLLINNESLRRNSQKYMNAIKQIQTAAPKHLYSAPNIKPITKEHPVLWSVTSEFAPVKEGGLGSVPVDIQNNNTKLGVETPTFIPMYQEPGLSSFREENGKYIYTYSNKSFNLEKAASFKVEAYRNGQSKIENVDVFVHNSKDEYGNNKQLIFIKNDNYFNGTIYNDSNKSEEAEKFAFFSKAVYEFAKAKEDINSAKDLKIENKEVFDSVKAPDGLILNDWQASPIAALIRYKAPMENAYGKLSDSAADKLSDLNIITIGHNAMYQGSTRMNNDSVQRKQSTSNILNTLFDKFAYEIVQNADTKAQETNPKDKGLKNLNNVLLMNAQDSSANHTNLLNMGICLSDYFCPVSKNYAQELVSDEHPELSDELRWALTQRNNTGSLFGVINGNDFNNLSIEAKENLIKKQTGLVFDTYNKQSSIDEVMSARTNNKINFYNNYMVPFSYKNDLTKNTQDIARVRSLTDKLEFVDEKGATKLENLPAEEIIQTPIISSVGRLVTQKGIGIMSDAIEMLMKNWEHDFPGKPKPIFYIAGQDGEDGSHRKKIEDLKNKKLSDEDSKRIIFAHGFAPMSAITAASDFFLLPSIFEPCGLTQGEAFAVGTPVIGSAVGGIVDTVNRNDKTNGILTDKSKPLDAKQFYEAMKKGLNIYFNDKEQYNKMVSDSLGEDFSWTQPNRQGPIYDYLDLFGKDRQTLPEVSA